MYEYYLLYIPICASVQQSAKHRVFIGRLRLHR
jgi:hypothetical protein